LLLRNHNLKSRGLARITQQQRAGIADAGPNLYFFNNLEANTCKLPRSRFECLVRASIATSATGSARPGDASATSSFDR